MAKQQSGQRYVLKLHSTRLRKAGWNLALPLAEARRGEEVITLADSQLLTWLDELNGVGDTDAEEAEIRREIRRLKKEEPSLKTRRRIRKLYADLADVQYKPDYVEVIVDREKDFRRACQGFTINGQKYHRLLGTNGGVKQSTIVFLADRHGDEIRRRIENGRDASVELVPAKYEAYKALTCSASTPVSMPKGIIVVDDCETKFRSDVIYVSDEDEGEPLVEPRSDQEITLTESDGYGVMLPSLAARWGEELGLDYVPSGVNTRFAFEKGMLFTFDFLEFAEKVAGKYLVKDAWGTWRDVREAEVIMTTSMLKLWDSYPGMEEYLRNTVENGYQFRLTKVCPKELENEHALNYQFIQSYHLTDDEIEELIKPTMDEIRDVLHADWRKTVLFLKGKGLNADNVEYLEDNWAKAIMIEPKVLDDPYIQNCVYQLIRKRIDEAKIGVLNVHGNYSIVSGDPYSLCQHAFGLEVTGLMKAGEIYSRYWLDLGVERVACFRAPMSTHHNILVMNICRSEEAQHWYRYMTTCTAFNSWDTSAAALNGMD